MPPLIDQKGPLRTRAGYIPPVQAHILRQYLVLEYQFAETMSAR
jgi:hypothetical protein